MSTEGLEVKVAAPKHAVTNIDNALCCVKPLRFFQ